ncbi:MAG: TetR/AcrR family transcriptional regulator [bacterium]|nr:TetR/AcrR family transcriptional regulator [bacterium]
MAETIGPLLERALSENAEEPKNARERSRVETRRRLMEAWRELVGESASANVSIRDIAAKAQVSVGAFYCHFKDKDALHGEVAIDCLAKLVRELDKLPGSVEGDAETRLATVLNVMMDFAEDHPSEFTFLWRLGPSETEEGREFLRMWHEFWEERIEAFSEGFFAGVLFDEELDRRVLARALWGIGERILSWWLRDRDRIPREVVVRTFARFVAKGMA